MKLGRGLSFLSSSVDVQRGLMGIHSCILSHCHSSYHRRRQTAEAVIKAQGLSRWLMVCTFCFVQKRIFFFIIQEWWKQKSKVTIKLCIPRVRWKEIHETHLLFCMNNVFHWLHLTGCFLKQERCATKLRTAEVLCGKYWYILLIKIQFLYNIPDNSKFICYQSEKTHSGFWHHKYVCNPS